MPAPVPSLLVALALAFAPTSRGAGPLPVPVDTTALQRLLQAEDARGTGPDGLVPLLASLRGRDTLLRRVAVRGLGRLQRPGGGPDANEYVGDASFMRDELTLRMHARGTLGISARGRDTGDGQWFLNLVANPLLDHEFTLFGRIDEGRAVAERMLEGDRIARVVVVDLRTP